MSALRTTTRERRPSVAHRSGSSRVDAIDGLRALAVAAVIGFHFGWGPEGGFLGVDLFFVISGFVITRALITEETVTGRISISGFWRRRIRRIFPPLALVLAAVMLWSFLGAVSASFQRAAAGQALAALVSGANWWQIFGPGGYWSLDSGREPLTHLWSLGVEEQFYLVFPLLFLLLVRFVARPRRWVLASGAAAIAYAWAAVLRMTGEQGVIAATLDRVYLGTDTRSGALLLGCALALFLMRHPVQPAERAGAPAPTTRISTAIALAALTILGVSWVVARTDMALFFPVILPLCGVAAALLIGALVSAPSELLARVLSWPPIVLLGRWSYSLYLWHWVVWVFLQQSPIQAEPYVAPVALGITLVLSAGTYYLVERPILRRTWSWRSTAVGLVGASVVLAAVATFLLATVELPEDGTGGVSVTTH